MRRRALALAALALLAGACGGGDGDSRAVVFAAASLSEVFETIDPESRFNFAGSDELARQIREGARADVYAAASPRYPQELLAEGLVDRPVVFAKNRLVVVVPAANPARIGRLDDVGSPGVKLVVGAEGVPIGDYTRDVLERTGRTRLLANVVSEEEDVKGVIGKVALGEADAGFVYATDARTAGDRVHAIELPADAPAEVRYEAALVRQGENADAGRAFLGRLLGEEGRTALLAAGFGMP